MINMEKLFTQIQNVINANPVIVLGTGASISYNISSMWDLVPVIYGNSDCLRSGPQVEGKLRQYYLDFNKKPVSR